MIVLQFHKPMTVAWGADLGKGHVPMVKMQSKQALQIIVDEDKGTVSMIESKE